MNRIDQKFKNLKSLKKKAFIAYVTAGDPNLSVTEELIVGFEQAGVDIVEIGVPFSDPMADGTTIQAASQRALKSGTTLNKVFDLVKRIRRRSQIPLAFMLYYNQVFSYGETEFILKCSEVGIDGLIIPDLPPEEAMYLRRKASQRDISTIFFVAPTTVDARIKANAAASTGFIYYVALTGVTGTTQASSNEVIAQIKRAKKFTSKPICAGFGISTPQQVKEIAQIADGVIVGSAIIKEIEKNRGSSHLQKNVLRYVSSLTKVLA